MLPQRAGQPVRLELDITLDELLSNAGRVARLRCQVTGIPVPDAVKRELETLQATS